MAAILCQSISSLCSATCSGCGKICSLPCTVCSSVCKPLCEGVRKLCTSHFCLYGSVAIGLNLPQIIFSFSGMSSIGCKGSQWLLVNLLFSLSHIVAAFYLASQSTSWDDTLKTLCYDPWIAGYILVGIASFVWLCMGLDWATSGAIANGNCSDNIGKLVYDSIYCGFAFFGVGMTALGISILISMCMGRNSSWSGGNANGNGVKDQNQSDATYYAFNGKASV